MVNIIIAICLTSLVWIGGFYRYIEDKYNSTPYCNGLIETNRSLINVRDLKFTEKDIINNKPGIRIFCGNNIESTFDFNSEQERDENYNKIVEVCKSYYEFIDKYN